MSIKRHTGHSPTVLYISPMHMNRTNSIEHYSTLEGIVQYRNSIKFTNTGVQYFNVLYCTVPVYCTCTVPVQIIIQVWLFIRTEVQIHTYRYMYSIHNTCDFNLYSVSVPVFVEYLHNILNTCDKVQIMFINQG